MLYLKWKVSKDRGRRQQSKHLNGIHYQDVQGHLFLLWVILELTMYVRMYVLCHTQTVTWKHLCITVSSSHKQSSTSAQVEVQSKQSLLKPENVGMLFSAEKLS